MKERQFMKEDEMTAEECKVQEVLSKVISEEMLANLLYHNAVLAMQPEDICKVFDMFKTIADDELDDHHRALCTYAFQNCFAVPFSEKEYKKFADKAQWDAYDSMKKGQDASYYIQLAMQLEVLAVKSYEEMLKDRSLPYDLLSILQKNYYDELQHLEDLKTLSLAAAANANLAWTSSYDTTEMAQYTYWW